MSEAAANKPSIAVCKGCGKLFPRAQAQLCPTCGLSTDKRFDLVREFVDANPGTSVPQIALATGLPRSEVSTFLDEGRLVSREAQTERTLGCSCEPGGARCAYCRREMAMAFRDLHKDMSTRSPSGPQQGENVKYVRRIHRQAD